MLLLYDIRKSLGPKSLRRVLLAAAMGLAASAQAQEEPVDTAPPPEPKAVSCGWDGFTTLPDPNCIQTQQRRVLTCTDGTLRVGQCVA